jgi:hypothetical protein
MKNSVFWDVVPYSSCVNRRFGGTYRFHLQGGHIPENGILHSHHHEKLKSYKIYMIIHIKNGINLLIIFTYNQIPIFDT